MCKKSKKLNLSAAERVLEKYKRALETGIKPVNPSDALNTPTFALSYITKTNQSEIGRKHRYDCLREKLFKIINSDLNYKTKDVLKILKNYEGDGCIDEVTDDYVEWWPKDRAKQEPKKTSINALAKRISLIKKQINSP